MLLANCWEKGKKEQEKEEKFIPKVENKESGQHYANPNRT